MIPCIEIICVAALGSLVLGASAALAAAPAEAGAPPPDRLPAVQELPNPFVFDDGRPVRDGADWARRREEVLRAVLDYEYGALPPRPEKVAAEELAAAAAEDGSVRKSYRLTMGPEGRVAFVVDVAVPPGSGRRPAVIRGDGCWGPLAPEIVREVLRRGYVLLEFDRTRVAPDGPDRSKGVYAAYPQCDGGALAAWAWAIHRCVDFLRTQPDVDPRKIAVTGHSRGGKAALLAGATDERIALTVPNNSGCGGAGCYRFQGPRSEDIAAITKRFPYWFGPRFKEFVGRVERLPFDQHSLKALVAPRALLTTEALGDAWANSEGTWHTHRAAAEVYRFLGAADRIAVVYRPGKHQHNADDWNVLLDFADVHLLGKKPARAFAAAMFPDSPSPFAWRAPAPPALPAKEDR